MKYSRLLLLCFVCFPALVLSGCVLLPSEKPDRTISDQISGKEWLLAGYSNGNIFIPLEADHGSRAVIEFNADGTLEGDTGINEFSGQWTVKARRTDGSAPVSISVGDITDPLVLNETASKFEQDMLRGLNSAVRMQTGTDSFTLLSDEDTILLYFIFRGDSLF
ncbi:META domain-containing protein [Brucepastera parasyntrophica]|uniref:META domain-containing protein n=1 Tax=Brucepastera parasyntrophica TaxID=2880008 RepID=UPI00210E0F3D|nr:META domain-containing protein [Brucepastera parasyntrophica]ULQ58805.1 META domain-containing protein [Brucepastera parasyntrophica]